MFFQGLISILVPIICLELAFRFLAGKSLIKWVLEYTRLDNDKEKKTKIEKLADERAKSIENIEIETEFTDETTDLTNKLREKKGGLDKSREKLGKAEKKLNN